MFCLGFFLIFCACWTLMAGHPKVGLAIFIAALALIITSFVTFPSIPNP